MRGDRKHQEQMENRTQTKNHKSEDVNMSLDFCWNRFFVLCVFVVLCSGLPLGFSMFSSQHCVSCVCWLLSRQNKRFLYSSWLAAFERTKSNVFLRFRLFFHKTLVFLMLVVACICFLTKALVVLRCLRVFSGKNCFPYVLGWFHSNTLVFSRCLATVLYFLAKAATNLRNTNVSSQTP